MVLRTEGIELLRDHNQGKLLLAKSAEEFQSLRVKFHEQVKEIMGCLERLKSEKSLLEKDLAEKELTLAKEKAERSQAERSLATQAEEQEKLRSLAETNLKEIFERIGEVKSAMEIVHPIPDNPQLNGIDQMLQELRCRKVVGPQDLNVVENLLKNVDDR
jgi:chromosome segregation ATPase